MNTDYYMKILGYITFSCIILYVLNKLLHLNNNLMLWALDSRIKEGMVFSNNLSSVEKKKIKNKLHKKKLKEGLIDIVKQL